MTTITGYTSYAMPQAYASTATSQTGMSVNSSTPTSSASTLVSISASALALYSANSTMPVSVSKLIGDYDFNAHGLKSTSTLTLPVLIQDSAANFSSLANITKLNAILSDNSASDNISEVKFTDMKSPTVKFSNASTSTTLPTLAASKALLAKLQSPYFVGISDVSYSDFKALKKNDYGAPDTATLQLSGLKDSLINIVDKTALLALADMVKANTLSTVTLSDSTPPSATDLSATEYSAAQPLIKKLPTTALFSLNVTGAAASNLAVLGADKRVVSVTISDSASNIALGLAALKTLYSKSSNMLKSVVVEPAETLTLNAAQATANKDLLATAAFTDVHIQIADTAANIASNIAGLDSLAKALKTTGSKLDQVTAVDGNVITVDATDFLADIADEPLLFRGNFVKIRNASLTDLSAIKKISASDTLINIAGVDLIDKASTLSGDIKTGGTGVISASMKANVVVSSISVSDGKALALSAKDVTDQSDILGLIPANYSIQVEPALNVADALDLQSPSPTAKLRYSLADTGTNISGNLDDLQSLVKAGTVTSMAISVPATISLTPVQYKSDSDALKALKGSYKLEFNDATTADLAGLATAPYVSSIGVTDTGSSISKNFSALVSLAKSGKLGDITVIDDAPITVTAKQYMSLASIAGAEKLLASVTFKLTNATVADLTASTPPLIASGALPSNVDIVDVQDSSKNIAKSLLDLQSVSGSIGKIVFTDNKPQLDLVYDDLAKYSDLLGLAQTKFKLAVTDQLTADKALGLTPPTPNATLLFQVKDTQAAIQDNIDALQVLVKSKQLTGLQMSDEGQPFALSAISLKADVDAIKLLKPKSLVITDVSVSDALNLPAIIKGFKLTGTPPYTFALNDTAKNLSAGWSNLDSLFKKGLVSDITVSDSNPVSLSFAMANKSDILKGDGAPIFHDGVTLILTNMKASDITQASNIATALGAKTDFATVAGVEISDTAGNVGKKLSDLAAARTPDGSLLVSKITITDKTPMSLTALQLSDSANADVLALIGNPYSIKMDSIIPIDISQALRLVPPNKNATILPYALTDTPDNIVASLTDVLKLVAAKSVSQIGFKASTSKNILSLSKDLLAKSAPVLALLKGTYGIGLTNLTASDAVALAKTAKLQSVTIKDSIASLTNNLASLKSVLGKVTTINLTDTSPEATKLKTLQDGVKATNAAIVFKNASGTTI